MVPAVLLGEAERADSAAANGSSHDRAGGADGVSFGQDGESGGAAPDQRSDAAQPGGAYALLQVTLP